MILENNLEKRLPIGMEMSKLKFCVIYVCVVIVIDIVISLVSVSRGGKPLLPGLFVVLTASWVYDILDKKNLKEELEIRNVPEEFYSKYLFTCLPEEVEEDILSQTSERKAKAKLNAYYSEKSIKNFRRSHLQLINEYIGQYYAEKNNTEE